MRQLVRTLGQSSEDAVIKYVRSLAEDGGSVKRPREPEAEEPVDAEGRLALLLRQHLYLKDHKADDFIECTLCRKRIGRAHCIQKRLFTLDRHLSSSAHKNLVPQKNQGKISAFLKPAAPTQPAPKRMAL